MKETLVMVGGACSGWLKIDFKDKLKKITK
jgi:hypothetical protein